MSGSEASRSPRRLLLIGLAVAVLVLIADQASKFWVLHGFNLASKGVVPILPFFDLLLVWNKGISYGLFQQDGPLGQWLLLALKGIAVALLWIWMSRAGTRLTALALGLVIGGALGNAIDRMAHGAVMDFAHLHLFAAGVNLSWYVFNLADVAVVAGVAVLLYESLWGDGAAKAP
jgi:signal peptidase II